MAERLRLVMSDALLWVAVSILELSLRIRTGVSMQINVRGTYRSELPAEAFELHGEDDQVKSFTETFKD